MKKVVHPESSNTKLLSLNLSGNLIDDEGAEYIAKVSEYDQCNIEPGDKNEKVYTVKVAKMAVRLRWPSAKMAIFFKSPNLFFIIYIKLSRKFGQVLMYKAAKMAGNQVNVNAFQGIFGHLNSK